MKVDLKTNEQIVKEGPTNLKKGMEYAGGRLYLTSLHRIIHIPHTINLQRNIVEIELSDVVEVLKARVLLVPNAITLKLKNGTKYKFVVNKRQEWIDTLHTNL